MRAEQATILISSWLSRARRTEAAHYSVASRYARRQELMTTLVIILAAFTGSGLLATLATTSKGFRLALGIISIIGAGVAGLERSLRYGERGERHRVAGARWAPIVNQIESIAVGLPRVTPPDGTIDEVRNRMDGVTAESPYIPQRVFNKFRIGETYLSVDADLLARDC